MELPREVVEEEERGKEEEKRGEMRLLSFTSLSSSSSSSSSFFLPLFFSLLGGLFLSLSLSSFLSALLFRKEEEGEGKWSSKSWSYNEMKRLFVPGYGFLLLLFLFLSLLHCAKPKCPPFRSGSSSSGGDMPSSLFLFPLRTHSFHSLLNTE